MIDITREEYLKAKGVIAVYEENKSRSVNASLKKSSEAVRRIARNTEIKPSENDTPDKGE